MLAIEQIPKELSFNQKLIEELSFKWDLSLGWTIVVLAFFVALFLAGVICVVTNSSIKTRENLLSYLPPVLFVGYFFPVAFHLLRPNTADKVTGIIFIVTFFLLFIMGVHFFYLSFDSTFCNIAIWISVPFVLYGAFLICTIIYHIGYLSAIEENFERTKRLKVENENKNEVK